MSEHRDQTLVLIDCFALIHRAYHAFAQSNLSTSDGQPTHALYGFAGLLLDVLIKFKPSHVVAVFDAGGPTVRHEEYDQYKANRSRPEADMLSQIPMIEELLDVFDIPRLSMSGFEADDIIGTIDHKHSGEWARTIIVTGDRDLFQLVDADTFVYLAGGSFSKSGLFDANGVKEKMGVGPEYITDIKALQGDASDNIPGVAGIGEKGAVSLISQFGHVENLFQHLDEVENRYRQKLESSKEIAMLSKKLATIIRNVPIEFDFDAQAKFGTFDSKVLRNLFLQWEFRSLLTRLDKVIDYSAPKLDDLDQVQQTSMFAEPIELKTWDGTDPVFGGKVYLTADYIKPADPLTWLIKQIYLLKDEQVYVVSEDQIEKLFGFVREQDVWVVTDDGKALLHALANSGQKTNFKLYDLVISTYLQSSGGTGQNLSSVINYHLKQATEDKSVLTQSLAKAYSKHVEGIGEDMKLKKLIELERRLLPVVVEMERNGIKLNPKEMAEYELKLSEAVSKLEGKIFEEVGYDFNILSPKQVGEALFEKRGLPTNKRTKTGNFSTDERTLKELVALDPVVQMILDYRELTKLLSTYISPIPKLINPDTGRIHGEFNQIGALTGRFSSTNPNMQNIPLNEVEGIQIRNAFVADEGNILVSLDYSQQELRLLAELSEEKQMLETFLRNEDIHSRTAMEIFGIDSPEKVTKEQRKMAKTINFGIIYGISGFGLSDRLKIDPRLASDFIRKYFEQYPGVKVYYDKLLHEAKQNGYVETLLGRRRHTADLLSSNFHLRQATEREVMNFPLQGSAADLVKLAMVEIAERVTGFPVRLVLQVHDELIFEYKGIKDPDLAKTDSEFLDFVSKVRQTMLSVFKLKVPLEVGVEVGCSWGDMQELSV